MDMKLIDIAILTNIKNLGPANIRKILAYSRLQHICNLYELVEADLTNVLSKKLSEAIMEYLDTDLSVLYKNMEYIIDDYQNKNIHCISINDDKYPDILKQSTNPPVILYCKGNINLLNSKCIAVIGTRENTDYGKKIATKTVKFLVENNFTIVSGLAKGIDTIAHNVSLQSKGKTIAILPLIDNIYPAENKSLANDILKNDGLLISEEKPKTKFYSGQLVKRDRIQSGLSKAVFVIETSLKGGSMHATNDALKLSRPVFTPNIYIFDKKYQDLKQVEGIKNLIDSNISTPYTSKNYNEILSKLHLSLQRDTLW